VLVADFGGHSASEILFEQDRLLGHFTPREEARQAAATDFGAGAQDASGVAITAFAANQRDELRDLHDVSAALCAHPSVKQQTFIAESGSLTPWDTQQARIHTPNVVAPAVCGADGGGGRNPAGLLLEDADCLTTWDVQSRRIHSDDGVWPALYGGEGGGHGYVASFCAGAGAKAQGIGYEQECAPTLKSGGGNGMPSVLCLNDQGGQRMDISDNMTGTLRSQMESHPPLVMATQQGGAEICEDLCPTITSAAGTSGNNQPVVFENHGLCD
jgi:DNA (cytosine-5)-methyltransferase 1